MTIYVRIKLSGKSILVIVERNFPNFFGFYCILFYCLLLKKVNTKFLDIHKNLLGCVYEGSVFEDWVGKGEELVEGRNRQQQIATGSRQKRQN